MKRSQLVEEITKTLAKNQLVWFGTRGEDIESIADIAQFSAAFSITGRYTKRSNVESLALEDLSGVRVDLDQFEIDDELHTATVGDLKRAILGFLGRPSAVVTYRPSTFLSAIAFARQDRCEYLGMFKDHQVAFEHKPWVETEIARLGIPHLSWTYIADHEQIDALKMLQRGSVVLRRSRSSGGTGVMRLDTADHLHALWPNQPEGFVGVSPFIADGIPINIGGVVWRDGVTVHPPSLQLIGVPELTSRAFGYCGNDFGAITDIDNATLGSVVDSTVAIGKWLQQYRYRGAFGVDFLVSEGVPLFLEVNPRFQGSSHLSCQISVENDESCIMLEHIAACMGMVAPPSLAANDLRAFDHGLAHFIVHSQLDHRVAVDSDGIGAGPMSHPKALRHDLKVPAGLLADPGAAVTRITVRQRLTVSGYSLVDPWPRLLVPRGAAPQGAD